MEESIIHVEAAILSLKSLTDTVMIMCSQVHLADVMCQECAAPVMCRDPTQSTPFQRSLKGNTWSLVALDILQKEAFRC